MDPKSELLVIAIVFVAAQLGSFLSRALKMPSVIGEILAGVALGPSLFGLIHPGPVTSALAAIGAVVLLFTVGLETPLSSMIKVGKTCFIVALLGVIIPFFGGFILNYTDSSQVKSVLYIACCFMATSAGITASVLRDEKVLSRVESHIILTAAIIDDVLALLILVLVSGFSTGHANPLHIVALLSQALLFIGIALGLGLVWARQRKRTISKITPVSPLVFALAICLILAAVAERTGLAAIVGAFIAGLVIAEHPEHKSVEKQVQPLLVFLTPFFFVMTGVMVDVQVLKTSIGMQTFLLFVLVAVATKVFGAGLGAIKQGWRSAVIIGVGMVPRGEVGIIIAGTAFATGNLSSDMYSLLVLMSVATTMIAPPVLKKLLSLVPKGSQPVSEGDMDGFTAADEAGSIRKS